MQALRVILNRRFEFSGELLCRVMQIRPVQLRHSFSPSGFLERVGQWISGGCGRVAELETFWGGTRAFFESVQFCELECWRPKLAQSG